jgi:pimeloyl-ACP methyl ester carboxylesterase
VRLPISLRLVWNVLALVPVCVAMAGCQSVPRGQTPLLGASLDETIRVMASPQSIPRQRIQAEGDYRDLVAAHLPELLADAAEPGLVPAGQDLPGIYRPDAFAAVAPAPRTRVGEPGLHRAGLGLPLIGRIDSADPNAPRAGFHVPLTLVALPKHPPTRCCDTALVDPDRVGSVHTAHGELPVAMDLEAPLGATRATGPRWFEGLANLLRTDRFAGPGRIVFLEPYDPGKRPLVLVHGLMSTPRMWAPLVKALLADERIRAGYQIWAFYYPTGQPVPLSALQLREALDEVEQRHGPLKPMVLVGHSMGGILSRAQVSRIAPGEAERMSPGVSALPADNLARRALIFEPRTDVSRVVFQFTPHRGSRLAANSLAAWGVRLIRLPEWLVGELAYYSHHFPDAREGRLPTSIHGLSPNSRFLRALDKTRPAVPVHTVVGTRGRSDLARSSDGVVSYSSAHLYFAESEIAVPTGHGGFAHPLAVAELRRILHQELGDGPSDARKAGFEHATR